MTDWQSPEEMLRDATAFNHMMHALFGLYLWEWFISLDFEWEIISGKRRFKWPLIFYFAGRYLLLGTMIGIVVALDATKPLNCFALYLFNQLAGSACAGLACINLSLRTIAVWGHNRYVMYGLILLILGHWSVILQGVQLTVSWQEPAGCVIQKTNNTLLAATFIYSMSLDLVVLLLNVWKLGMGTMGLGAMRKHSSVAQLIFGDGLIYFFIAFISNLVATVFMILNLNAVMNVIFNVPAVIAATIVSGRLVRRLNNFGKVSTGETYSHTASNVPISQDRGINATTGRNRAGVQIRMETFTQSDNQGLGGARPDYDDKEPHRVAFAPTSPSDEDVEAKGTFH
jgi:hypothetical protein